jgi:dolichol-phosphate mannosyltransferase
VGISAGLENASGDLAIVITADLEEPPEAIPDFLKMWREGHHLVWGIRATRANRGLSALASRAYHRIFAWLADQAPGQGEIGGGYFLADARVLDTVRRFSESNRSIIGLLLWAGFKHGRITYQPASRKFGRSKWSLTKKLKLALDTFVAFSNRPLRVLLGAGSIFLFLAFAALVVAVIMMCRRGGLDEASAIASAAFALTLIVGVNLFAIGLLGEYIWRNLDEARGRPLYVVMDRIGLVPPPPTPLR